MAAPTVTQSAKATTLGTSASLTVTLGSAPTVGNELIALLFQLGGNAPSAPTGWRVIGHFQGNQSAVGAGGFIHLTVMAHTVAIGDGASYVFPMAGSGSSSYPSHGVIYEASGCDAQAVLAICGNGDSGTAGTEKSCTGLMGNGCTQYLALAAGGAFTQMATAMGAIDATNSVGAWTRDQDVTNASTYGALMTAHASPGTSGALLLVNYTPVNTSNPGSVGAVVLLRSSTTTAPYVQASRISQDETTSGETWMPVDPTVGNTLVGFIGILSSTTPAVPTGWTSILQTLDSANGAVCNLTSMYKPVASVPSEPLLNFSAYAGGNNQYQGHMAIYEVAGTMVPTLSAHAEAGAAQTEPLPVGPVTSPNGATRQAWAAMMQMSATFGVNAIPKFDLGTSLPSGGWLTCGVSASALAYGNLAIGPANVAASTSTKPSFAYTSVNSGNTNAAAHLFFLIPGGASGSAAVSASTSVTAVGLDTEQGTAGPAAATNISVGGLVTEVGVVSVNATSTVTASGLVTEVGSSAVTVSTAIGAAGLVSEAGTASVTAVSSVTAAGLVTEVGAAAITVSTSVATAGIALEAGTATVTATSNITASGLVLEQGSAGVTVATSISTSGVVSIQGVAQPTTSSSVTVAGIAQKLSIVAVTVHTSIGVAASVIVPTSTVLEIVITAQHRPLTIYAEVRPLIVQALDRTLTIKAR